MLQPEQILHNRYQLKQQLGQLAGRQTWLAQDLAVQPAQPVVLKLLICGESMQWNDLRLFEREAQVLRQLNHPQIPGAVKTRWSSIRMIIKVTRGGG